MFRQARSIHRWSAQQHIRRRRLRFVKVRSHFLAVEASTGNCLHGVAKSGSSHDAAMDDDTRTWMMTCILIYPSLQTFPHPQDVYSNQQKAQVRS